MLLKVRIGGRNLRPLNLLKTKSETKYVIFSYDKIGDLYEENI